MGCRGSKDAAGGADEAQPAHPLAEAAVAAGPSPRGRSLAKPVATYSARHPYGEHFDDIADMHDGAEEDDDGEFVELTPPPRHRVPSRSASRLTRRSSNASASGAVVPYGGRSRSGSSTAGNNTDDDEAGRAAPPARSLSRHSTGSAVRGARPAPLRRAGTSESLGGGGGGNASSASAAGSPGGNYPPGSFNATRMSSSTRSSSTATGTATAKTPKGTAVVRGSKGQQQLPPSLASLATQHVVIKRGEVLGRGGYGTVYRAYNKSTKAALAVKECIFDESNVSLVTALRKEYETLSQLDHPHIIRVHHLTVEANHVARIYMELAASGSVRSVMRQLGGRFSETSARRIIHQALLGLEYLHGRGILHRDMKPDNMLVDANGIVKLSDFGTSKATLHAASGTTTMVVGTVVYMAPETISGRYSAASDVWAIAAAFIELVSGDLPWSELKIDQSVALLFHIGNAQPPNHHPRIPPFVQSARGRRLLKRCFALDPRQRPSVSELLADPYFGFEDFAGTDADHAARPGARRPSAATRSGAESAPVQRRPQPEVQPPRLPATAAVNDVYDDDGGPQAAHLDEHSDSLGDSFASIEEDGGGAMHHHGQHHQQHHRHIGPAAPYA